MLLIAAALLFMGGEFMPCGKAATCEPAANLSGFVGGSLIGVASFGAFMADDRTHGVTRRLIPWIAGLAWALGIWHVFGFALHLTRLL